jgi:hypothetical protein
MVGKLGPQMVEMLGDGRLQSAAKVTACRVRSRPRWYEVVDNVESHQQSFGTRQ